QQHPHGAAIEEVDLHVAGDADFGPGLDARAGFLRALRQRIIAFFHFLGGRREGEQADGCQRNHKAAKHGADSGTKEVPWKMPPNYLRLSSLRSCNATKNRRKEMGAA